MAAITTASRRYAPLTGEDGDGAEGPSGIARFLPAGRLADTDGSAPSGAVPSEACTATGRARTASTSSATRRGWGARRHRATLPGCQEVRGFARAVRLRLPATE